MARQLPRPGLSHRLLPPSLSSHNSSPGDEEVGESGEKRSYRMFTTDLWTLRMMEQLRYADLSLKLRWDIRYKTTSVFTCCSDVQVCPVTSLVGVVTGGQQSSHSPLRTFNSSSLLYFHPVLKFFLFRSMLNYMLFVLKEQYVKILVKTFRN